MNIIGEPTEGMLTRSMAAKLTAASANECLFVDFISEIEPKNVKEALTHPSWVQAMHDELEQFDKNKVMTLVKCPEGVCIIGMKWVFKNNTDENGTVIKNKADLLPKVSTNKRALTSKKPLPLLQEWKPSGSSLHMQHT